MGSINDTIAGWAVDRIEKNYKDDVSLLVTYGSYINGTANHLSDVDFYFIPKTDRAYELCQTFIVKDIGYDLFPMSWERVEGLADFKECLTPCLANVKILYCNSEDDRNRFEALQNRLRKNLDDKTYMLEQAFKKLEEALSRYKTMLFEEDICELRVLAGFLLMVLSDGVAYANQTYFSRGLKKQIEDLKNMGTIPKDYLSIYQSIIEANSAAKIKEYCLNIIKVTRSFLNERRVKPKDECISVNYEEIAVMYQELCSTWNKVYLSCDNGDVTLAYISGVCLQDVLNMAEREMGFKRLDLMNSFDAKDLVKFKNRALQLQKELISTIEENGVQIKAYNTLADFIDRDKLR